MTGKGAESIGILPICAKHGQAYKHHQQQKEIGIEEENVDGTQVPVATREINAEGHYSVPIKCRNGIQILLARSAKINSPSYVAARRREGADLIVSTGRAEVLRKQKAAMVLIIRVEISGEIARGVCMRLERHDISRAIGGES